MGDVEDPAPVQDPERQAQLLGIVAQDVVRLDRLITNIARASRIEAETARGDPGVVDLGVLLFELARAYAPAPDEEAGVGVAFRGPKPSGALVLGQEGPLGQVFRNLIDNARSFSPEGGKFWVAVEVVRGKDASMVRAVVEDDGPGIPPENLETVFERFYTQRPKGPAFGGNSGLGLSIRRVRILRKYEFRRRPDGALIARGWTQWIYVELSSGRPLPIPAEVLSLFPVMAESEDEAKTS